MARRHGFGLLVALAIAAPAAAEQVRFEAALRGDAVPTDTGSKATGRAAIMVDTELQTVDLVLDVTGMKTTDLWAQLKARPVGPIHLHMYGSHDHSNPDASELVLPTAFGPTYADTATGFRVTIRAFPYAEAQRILESKTGFDHFLHAMRSGAVRLNIHTNAHNPGEISGEVRLVGDRG